MRINVRSEGLELTSQLRHVAGSRLLSALGPFGRAITRAYSEVRGAVEREVSRLQAPPRASDAAAAGPDVLELALHENRISQQQREWLERPENYLRPVRLRDYLRPPRVQEDEQSTGSGAGHAGARHETVSNRTGLRRHDHAR
jgi:hypothetical protein